ncbi:glycosyl transferase family 2 [Jannaschia sp. S6380]|uniref:glycosyl transferase family 2 n=1 Tax=Jannaschia sp. S6380 TaxID=2926408 RepID=UPI001FF1567F|nr:glycosyl transferase family 2 [Jannaschia sp. S6380]MCK0168475.1 glycosyl transferase family 2 [Jannaschia sp. S6380]
MDDAPRGLDLSVLVATDADGGVDDTLTRCRAALDGLGLRYELLVIVDGRQAEHLASLRTLAESWDALTVIGQRPWSGEDAALATAVRRSSAELILMLPGWPQVEPADLARLPAALDDHDMVSAVRRGPEGGALQGFRQRLFGRVLRAMFGRAPADPFCRVHLVRRDTLEDVASFGVRQHFLPVIAAHRGHDTAEVTVAPAPSEDAETAGYIFKPLGHVRALFDALTLYVVLTFLRRPLRFFGAIGLPLFLAGAVMTAVLVVQRLLGDTALADRPLLIFAVLMIVLGLQIIAIGLVGEIIVFAGARRMKQYEVAEIITTDPRHTADRDAEPPGQVVTDARD